MKARKINIYTELCYVIGIISFAFGTVLMEKADFGMSMITAPSYIIFLKLSQLSSFFTFGTCCYLFQACVIIAMMLIVQKVRIHYLFSFFSAVFFGCCLDLVRSMLSFMPVGNLGIQVVYFILGELINAAGVAWVFHTYIPPESYEMIVMEVSAKYHLVQSKMKMGYDIFSLFLGIALSLLFFKALVGINVGTVICAFVNGPIIGVIMNFMDKHFEFPDRFPKIRARL